MGNSHFITPLIFVFEHSRNLFRSIGVNFMETLSREEPIGRIHTHSARDQWRSGGVGTAHAGSPGAGLSPCLSLPR